MHPHWNLRKRTSVQTKDELHSNLSTRSQECTQSMIKLTTYTIFQWHCNSLWDLLLCEQCHRMLQSWEDGGHFPGGEGPAQPAPGGNTCSGKLSYNVPYHLQLQLFFHRNTTRSYMIFSSTTSKMCQTTSHPHSILTITHPHSILFKSTFTPSDHNYLLVVFSSS